MSHNGLVRTLYRFDDRRDMIVEQWNPVKTSWLPQLPSLFKRFLIADLFFVFCSWFLELALHTRTLTIQRACFSRSTPIIACASCVFSRCSFCFAQYRKGLITVVVCFRHAIGVSRALSPSLEFRSILLQVSCISNKRFTIYEHMLDWPFSYLFRTEFLCSWQFYCFIKKKKKRRISAMMLFVRRS